MIKRITAAETLGIAEKFLRDDRLTPPILADRPVAEYLARFELILGHYRGDELTGAIVFIIDADSRYYEAVWVLTEDAEAVREAVQYLKDNHPDFSGDWVMNPRNTVALNALKELGAEVVESLEGYIFDGVVKFDADEGIIPLDEKHYAEYIAMHSKDVYWTAEKVIASEKFATWLAVENGLVVGYIDIFLDQNLSEIYDWQAPNDVTKSALVRAAISGAGSQVMMMLEGDSEADILKDIGFKRIPRRDNITLSLDLNTFTEVLA